jgi:hypothetical protein
MKGKTDYNLMRLFTLCQLNNMLTELCIVEIRYNCQRPWFVSHSDRQTGPNETVVYANRFRDSNEGGGGSGEICGGLKEDLICAHEREKRSIG